MRARSCWGPCRGDVEAARERGQRNRHNNERGHNAPARAWALSPGRRGHIAVCRSRGGLLLFDARDGRDQLVAPLGDGRDVARLPGAVAEGLAQLDDGASDRVIADQGAAPHLRLQFLSGHHGPGARCQVDEQIHRLGLQSRDLAVARDLACGGADHPGPEAEGLGAWRRIVGGAGVGRR